MFSYSPLLAAYDAYKLMKGEELPTVQPTPSVDSIASPAAAVALIVLIVIIVFMMTQKKRLAKKSVSIKKEKKRLCLRMTIFELLLVLSLTFPYLIGYNYKFAAIWLPYSILIAFTIFDIDLILLIVSSIMRYIRQKKLIKSN